jgi:NitT/TauT family transport system permease protein
LEESHRVPLWIRLVQAGLVLGVLLLWERTGTESKASHLIWSTPVDVLGELRDWATTADTLGSVATTLQEAAIGYLVGVALAVVLALLVAGSPLLGTFLSPYLSGLNALPKIVLAPLFILWFGISLKSKVIFVAAGIFFIVFYSLFVGLRSIDPQLVNNMRGLGASQAWLYREVRLPAVFGWLMTSLRLSSAWALLGAVVAEYLGSNHGVGYLIARGQGALEMQTVLAGIIVVAVIALALDRVMVRIERRFSEWRIL